jgi:hypothetical protein
VFRGVIERIEPDSGPQGRRRVVITCVDAIGVLASQRISMELQQNKRADQIIAGAVNLAYGAPAATGTITLTSNTLNGQTVTINGQTYTFKTALTPLAYEVMIGANSAATASNLKAAINGEGTVGTNYASGTNRLADVIASVSGSAITVTATLPGAGGNGYTLAKSGAGITLSGATLTGGADAPSGLVNYGQSTEAFTMTANGWTSDNTTALDIIAQAAFSDQGRFFVQRDGTVTYKDRLWFYKPLTTALALDANPFEMKAGRSVDRIYNVVNVTIQPRTTVAGATVLASANTVIRIPPLGPNGPGSRRVTLHFRDDSGRLTGGTELVLPLVPYTDYAVGDSKVDTSYTTRPYFYFGPFEVKASEITIPMYNTAIGPLYVSLLQVRGRAVTVYDPLTVTQSDATSQSAYQTRPLTLTLPLSSDESFAESLAQYVLDRYKVPFTAVESITVRNTDVINGVNVFSLNLFDVITVTDSQTGLSGVKCFITGEALHITPDGFTLTWHTARADDRGYWNLGVTGYGELGVNTRLAA